MNAYDIIRYSTQSDMILISSIGCSKTFAALSAMGAGGPIAGWINEGLKDRGTSVSLAQTSRRFLQRT